MRLQKFRKEYKLGDVNQFMMEKIKEYYTESVHYEWKRLVQDAYHRLEFDTTLRFLKKYLPKKGLILDAGGGPGRYTIELAKQGYDVVLLDLAPGNLEFAKRQIKKADVQNKVKGIVEGSITDLSKFTANTFDAVICLGGPLSHVEGKKNRDKAVSELIRVAKRDAPIFVSVFGKFGCLTLALAGWPDEISMTPHFRKFVKTGEDSLWHGRYYAHYFTSEELRSIFTLWDFKILELVGLEGLATPHIKAINKLAKNKKAWKNWLESHYKLCTHPIVAGISVHMLIIGRKK